MGQLRTLTLVGTALDAEAVLVKACNLSLTLRFRLSSPSGMSNGLNMTCSAGIERCYWFI